MFRRLSAVAAVVVALSVLPAGVASASGGEGTSARALTSSAPHSSPPAAQPADAHGCTGASAVITLCITVVGSSGYVKTVYAEKDYAFGYVNACDTVRLMVNGHEYDSSGRFCSPTGYYLSHTFNLYEPFNPGTVICTKWDSYPTHQACKTVY